MATNLSVIVLAFNLVAMESQGAIPPFSPDNARTSTVGVFRAAAMNPLVTPALSAFEAPLPIPTSPAPPVALAMPKLLADGQSREIERSTMFEAPLPIPTSPAPPVALAMPKLLADGQTG